LAPGEIVVTAAPFTHEYWCDLGQTPKGVIPGQTFGGVDVGGVNDACDPSQGMVSQVISPFGAGNENQCILVHASDCANQLPRPGVPPPLTHASMQPCKSRSVLPYTQDRHV